jgi:hypothetical protein
MEHIHRKTYRDFITMYMRGVKMPPKARIAHIRPDHVRWYEKVDFPNGLSFQKAS